MRNNEGSHLVFDIKDDISLIFLLLSSRLTSLDIKRLTGYPSLRLVRSLHTCVREKKKKKKGVKTGKMGRDKHAASYTNTSLGSRLKAESVTPAAEWVV